MARIPKTPPAAAKALREYRRDLGLTQHDVNSALMLPHGSVSRFEQGLQNIPPYIVMALGEVTSRLDFFPVFRRRCVFFLLVNALHAAVSRGLINLSFREASELADKLSHKLSK